MPASWRHAGLWKAAAAPCRGSNRRICWSTLDADPLGHGPDQLRNAPRLCGPPQDAFAGAVLTHLQRRGRADTDWRQGRSSDRRCIRTRSREIAIAIARCDGRRRSAQPALAGQCAAASRSRRRRICSAQPRRGLVLAGRVAVAGDTRAGALDQRPIAGAGRSASNPAEPRWPARRHVCRSGATTSMRASSTSSCVIGCQSRLRRAGRSRLCRAARQSAAFRLHLGLYADETAALCDLARSADASARSMVATCGRADGTASIVQPLIRPLYRHAGPPRVLALLIGPPDASPMLLCARRGGACAPDDFEAWWTRAA